jgi:membrane protease YdiL (CAAX protease family)
MTSPIEPRTASLYHAPRAPAVEPATAAAIVAAAIASYLVVNQVVPAELRFVAAQLALAAVGAIAAVIAAPARPLAVLGLRGARPRYVAAAVLIGATAWYVNAWLVAWLVQHLSLPDDHIQHLKGLVDRPAMARAFAAFALLPAVCEELVFRGVLARSLGRHRSLLVAAAISAAVFSAYHLSPVQALPTLTLGLALGAIAVRADSVLPTMLAHALNNAMAIAMSRGALAVVAGWLDGHPVIALVGCASATAGGLAIALRGPD